MSEENAGISICRRHFSQGNYSNIIFPLDGSFVEENGNSFDFPSVINPIEIVNIETFAEFLVFGQIGPQFVQIDVHTFQIASLLAHFT